MSSSLNKQSHRCSIMNSLIGEQRRVFLYQTYATYTYHNIYILCKRKIQYINSIPKYNVWEFIFRFIFVFQYYILSQSSMYFYLSYYLHDREQTTLKNAQVLVFYVIWCYFKLLIFEGYFRKPTTAFYVDMQEDKAYFWYFIHVVIRRFLNICPS